MLRERPKTSTGQEISFPGLSARLVSDAANPLLVPPALFLLLGWLSRISPVQMGWISGISMLFYTIIPFCIAFYLLHLGKVSSLDVPERQSRTELFIYSILSSSTGSLLLFYYFATVHSFLAVTALVFLVNPIIGLLMNFRWKVSIHTGAIATAGTLLLAYGAFFAQPVNPVAIVLSLLILLVLLPWMIWARYYLHIHSIPELIGGAFAGILFTLTSISIILWIW